MNAITARTGAGVEDIGLLSPDFSMGQGARLFECFFPFFGNLGQSDIFAGLEDLIAFCRHSRVDGNPGFYLRFQTCFSGNSSPFCHPRESGDPGLEYWIPDQVGNDRK
jgi:hypothetical protein